MNILGQPLVQQFAPLFERALNATLAMDPGAEKKLAPLNGCVLEIQITNMNQSLFIGAKGDKILLLSSEHAPTVTMIASLSTYIKLAASRDAATLFSNGELRFAGDAVRAQQIQRFTQELNVDWEGLLAKVFGDAPAKFLSSSAQQSIALVKTFSRSFVQDLEEFVKFELRLLPSRALAERQFQAIDQIRLASDRLEQRVKKLASNAKRS